MTANFRLKVSYIEAFARHERGSRSDKKKAAPMEVASEKLSGYKQVEGSRLGSRSNDNSASLPEFRIPESEQALSLGSQASGFKSGSSQCVSQNAAAQSLPTAAFRSLQRSSQTSSKELTNSEREDIDEKIISCLLSYNQNLLAAICEGSIVGDAAATLSAEILSLLRQQGREITENFTKRLVSKKMSRFVQKGSDLADVLRDNSMASMCLNSYARYEGIGFLSTCLKPAMAKILPTVGSIELDPNKLPAGTTEKDIQENETRLKSSVVIILHSILDCKLHMPHSIRRLCAFLKTHVLQSIKDQQMNASIGSSASQTTPARIAGGVPSIASEASVFHGSVPYSSSPLAQPSVTNSQTPSTANLPSIQEAAPVSTSLADSRLSSSDANMAIRVGTSHSATPKSSFSPIEHSTFAVHRKSSANVGSPNMASRLTGMLGLSSENVPGSSGAQSPTRKRATSVQIDAKNRFTLIEKIVSSFLFLRFFIPAITSPDVYGLLPPDCPALSLAQRRALLICGKIFTGICNDVDFGHKEEHLVTLNEFLRSWRGQIRQYIQWAMQGSGNETAPPANAVCNRQSSGAADPSPESGNILMPCLAVTGPNERTGSPKRFKTKDTLQPLGILGTNRHKLFAFLAQHIESLDASLNDQDFLSRLSPSELEGIKDNWGQLKSCISKSPYVLSDPRNSNQTATNFWNHRKQKNTPHTPNRH